MPNLEIHSDYDAMCRAIAQQIAALVREQPACVLGLATGASPVGVYRELVHLHREEGLDFSRVTSFNLDEYYGLEPEASQSYHRFMRQHLFRHINCSNWHVPDGRRRADDEVRAHCEAYEAAIREAGGIDLQLLGIGRTGHIGFNEPGSPQTSRTRLVTLDYLTRSDAAEEFGGLEQVPVRAITMGIGTILDARRVLLMAAGGRKAAIVRQALEDKITSKVPASFLREHPACWFHLDAAAASSLQQSAAPWRAPGADFHDRELRLRTLVELSLQLQRPLAELTPADLEANGAAPLAAVTPPPDAATEVTAELKLRLEDGRRLPRGGRVLCLSPHPDDDVICCGATLLKMVQRGNHVTVAYGVSGNVAVRDKDVLALLRSRHPRLISYLEDNAPPGQSLDDVFAQVRQFIYEREPGAADPPLLRQLKRLVREGEASDACRKMGAHPLFLQLPFYETGRETKQPITAADIETMLGALRTARPQLVLLTGENNDPHGTHEVCAQVFERAAELYLKEGGEPFARWHYRGAWEEYAVWQGGYFSLFDKELMDQKINLILDHISQLDPLFPGTTDRREFYERARDRNRATARQLQQLGILPPSRSFDPVYAEVFAT